MLFVLEMILAVIGIVLVLTMIVTMIAYIEVLENKDWAYKVTNLIESIILR